MAWRTSDRDAVVVIATPERPASTLSKRDMRKAIDARSQAWIDRLTHGSDDFEAGIAELHSLLLKGARAEISRWRAVLPHLRGEDYDDLALQSADDALVTVLRKLDEFRGECRFTTWAYRFVMLEAAARVRSRAWQRREIPSEPESWSVARAGASTAQERIEMKELLAALKVAVATDLSAQQREVFVAIALDDVSINVLATRMGRSRGAIYKTMHDARKKLRAALAARGIAVSDVPCETTNKARASRSAQPHELDKMGL